jgi:hypothetical protein
MSRQEELQKIVENLRSAISDARGIIIASTDGLAISHSLSGADPNRVAAMAATALGLGKRIIDTLNAGTFSETSVSGSDGQIFVYAAGLKGVLAVICGHGVNIGLIHLEARDAAKSIGEIL